MLDLKAVNCRRFTAIAPGPLFILVFNNEANTLYRGV